MNEITTDFNTDETINNINEILSETNIELPHRDTIINVLKNLNIKHAYCINYNATKSNYLLSQIAHTFFILLNNGSLLIKATKAKKKRC